MNNEEIMEHLLKGCDLSSDLTALIFDRIINESLPKSQVAAILALWRAKGETAEEISAATKLFLKKATQFKRPRGIIADIVGTGGDGYNTINVSTLSSLVAASCGVRVAKHGNVSVSSTCGSADVLKESGITMSTKQLLYALNEHNWCFLFAPNFHPAFKVVKPIRAELKIKTIFNLLGPLLNPLRPDRMVLGVYKPELLMPYAQALQDLGVKKALVVHGNGLDEVALHGPTKILRLENDKIDDVIVTANDFGLNEYKLEDVLGGSKEEHISTFMKVLKNEANDAHMSIIAANAACLLYACDKVSSFKDGASMAIAALKQKKTLALFRSLQGVCHA